MDRNSGYAVVLGGGGTKGSYQIGVWKALKQLGISYNCVVGTSIGAINGAFMVQNGYDAAYEMWRTLTIEKAFNIPQKNQMDIISGGITNLIEMKNSIIENKGLDTTPLKNLVKNLFDEGKLRNSKIDFGMVSYQLTNMKPVEIFMDEIPDGMLIDFIMASSALPGFKPVIIDGKQYLDGGLHNNLDHDMAKKRGYNKIIVVDVSGPGFTKRPEIQRTETIYIKNSEDLGGLLMFDEKNLIKNIELGYLDALKVFDAVKGIDYYIEEDFHSYQIIKDALLNREIYDNYKKIIKNSDDNIIRSLRRIIPKNIASHKDIVYILAEAAARTMQIDRLQIYNFKDFIDIILEKRNKFSSSKVRNSRSFLENAADFIKNTKISDISLIEMNGIINGLNGNGILSDVIDFIYPDIILARIFFTVMESAGWNRMTD